LASNYQHSYSQLSVPACETVRIEQLTATLFKEHVFINYFRS